MCNCNRCVSQALSCSSCVLCGDVPILCSPISPCCPPVVQPPAVSPFVVLCSCGCGARKGNCRKSSSCCDDWDEYY